MLASEQASPRGHGPRELASRVNQLTRQHRLPHSSVPSLSGGEQRASRYVSLYTGATCWYGHS
jgi:hypothetical protein